jgi:hypothetical protein
MRRRPTRSKLANPNQGGKRKLAKEDVQRKLAAVFREEDILDPGTCLANFR